jgi:Ca2+-binding RTX toxin-like protein
MKIPPLLDAQLDLTLILSEEKTGVGLSLISFEAYDLAADLISLGRPSSITSFGVPLLGLSPVTYSVVYGSNNIYDGSHNPYANYIMIAEGGNNTLSGGNGNDILIGGSGVDTLQGGLGNNLIIAGSGTETMAGISVQFNEAINTSDPMFVSVTGCILIGGSGTNVMAGLALFGAITDVTVSSFTNNGHFGGNTLIAGSGNATMYGVIGTTNSPNFNTALGVVHQTETVTGDSNTLYGGAGNDLLVGVMGTINCAHGSVFYNLAWNFAGNDLYAGLGTNTLIGSIDTYINVNPGATSFNGVKGSQVITLGDNLLVGGAGTDILIGDIRTLDSEIDPNQSLVTFNLGNNTLIAGTGNTTMVGGIQTITALDTSIINYGNDTFQFALNQHLGTDKILDMNAGGVNDTLKFTGVKDYNHNGLDYKDVDHMISSFVNDGTGHVKVNFTGGGSIDFANITWAHQTSIHDITPNVVVVV